MNPLTRILQDFWEWSGINDEEYAKTGDPTCSIEPFYYPRFEELKDICKQQINLKLTPQQMDDFLTCLALDSEVEDILEWCKDAADAVFLDELVNAGCRHLQPEARWQIAELLRCRNLPNRGEYLDILCSDSIEYVSKRAQNTKAFICDKGKQK